MSYPLPALPRLRRGDRAEPTRRVPPLRRADRRRLRLGELARGSPDAAVAGGPTSLWRYHELLPTARRVDVGAGWTPLVRCDPLSELLGIDLLLKLEGENPTRSYKDRIATLAVVGGARPRRDDPLLLVDREPRRRGRCGRGGDRARGDRARAGRRRVGGRRSARTPGARVFAVQRHLRRLPPARARARRALPVGLRQRQPPPVRERGREDDLVRDRRAARLASCPTRSSAPRRAARSSPSSRRASPS